MQIKDRQQSELEPTWDVAHLFPTQGMWTEGDYLALNTNRLAELSDGNLEVLEMPTTTHQRIVFHLGRALAEFVEEGNLGMVLVAPLPVKLWEDKFREPDVVFMRSENSNRIGEQYWQGADLIMEILSKDDVKRDLVIKRDEYARAGISEYWIVDPRDESITVLSLTSPDQPYTVAGEYRRGERAISVLLPSFAVDLDSVFPANQ